MWTTLALDAASGVIYRPIFSPLGYGGTRYGPLHFLIHAAFLKAGAAPIPTGFLMGIACALVTLAGIYVLMRKLQTPRSLAIPLTTFFLAAFCVRSGILSIKADLLAAGLDVWGLIVAFPLGDSNPQKSNWPRAVLAAICFALAVATKITSLFGICTIVTWLLLRRDFKNAARVLIIFLLAVAGIVTAVQFASAGASATSSSSAHRPTAASPVFSRPPTISSTPPSSATAPLAPSGSPPSSRSSTAPTGTRCPQSSWDTPPSARSPSSELTART